MWNFSKLLVRLATALSVACLSVGAVSAQAQAEPDQPPAVSASPKVTPSATSAASDPASAGYSVDGAIGGYWREHRELFGAPISAEVSGNGGAYQDFELGRIYWCSFYNPAATVRYAFAAAYAAHGGHEGWLGYPRQDEVSLPDGRAYQIFANGALAWEPGVGVRTIHGAFYGMWLRSWPDPTAGMGMPTSDEIDLGDGRVVQHFTKGDAYWSASIGEPGFVSGGIKAEWERLGGLYGPLGAPLGGESGGQDAVSQRFEHGRIVWSARYGSHMVRGGILHICDRIYGFINCGLPMTGEYEYQGKVRQDFERRSIIWP